MRRISLALAMIGVLTVGIAPVAARLSNDLPRGAIVVSESLPQTITQDTAGATVIRQEDLGCKSGGQEQATVWYRFTPSSSLNVLVDASASSYYVGINIFEGSADGALIECRGEPLTFFATAGTTYYVMFADVDEDLTNGGTLRATFDFAPPPIDVNLTVDPTATVSSSGVVTVTGTLSCTPSARFASISLFLHQTIGRFVIQGYGFAEVSCDTAPTSWVAEVSGDTNPFGGGSIDVSVSAFACDLFTCGDDFVDRALKARR